MKLPRKVKGGDHQLFQAKWQAFVSFLVQSKVSCPQSKGDGNQGKEEINVRYSKSSKLALPLFLFPTCLIVRNTQRKCGLPFQIRKKLKQKKEFFG